MYVTDILALNSGPLADLEIKAPFTSDGNPKPILLVGPNGSGKTAILSIVTDALIEIAAQRLQGVTPMEGIGRQFFRVLGGRSIRMNLGYEVLAAKFTHRENAFYYRSKAGNVIPSELATRMANYAPVSNWPTDKDDKIASGPANEIANIYNSGVYAFFPVTRSEMPYWVNSKLLDQDPNPP